MSTFSENISAIFQHMDRYLHVHLFLMMGAGESMTIALLWMEKITSGDWALVTTVLFGTSGIGGLLVQFQTSKVRPHDN